jgi:hypothetical protein
MVSISFHFSAVAEVSMWRTVIWVQTKFGRSWTYCSARLRIRSTMACW